jgi:hypothetical protein
MLICILLSGRIKSYKNFEILMNKIKDLHTIHLFVSVNDEFDENTTKFYNDFAEKFKEILKVIKIKKYVLPDGFVNTSQATKSAGKLINTLSCFYNDKMVFLEAEKYSNDNNINYDVYLRFRSDIIADTLPNLNHFNKNILFCVVPVNFFDLAITDNPNGEYKNGRYYCYDVNRLHSGLFVTSDIAFGSKDLMKIYCNCYDYILEQNIQNNGNYFICFEYNLTCYLHDINVEWSFFDYDYKYDINRF